MSGLIIVLALSYIFYRIRLIEEKQQADEFKKTMESLK